MENAYTQYVLLGFQENVLKSFTMNELYQQCKNNPIKRRKKNKKELEAEEDNMCDGDTKSEWMVPHVCTHLGMHGLMLSHGFYTFSLLMISHINITPILELFYEL